MITSWLASSKNPPPKFPTTPSTSPPARRQSQNPLFPQTKRLFSHSPFITIGARELSQQQIPPPATEATAATAPVPNGTSAEDVEMADPAPVVALTNADREAAATLVGLSQSTVDSVRPGSRVDNASLATVSAMRSTDSKSPARKRVRVSRIPSSTFLFPLYA